MFFVDTIGGRKACQTSVVARRIEAIILTEYRAIFYTG